MSDQLYRINGKTKGECHTRLTSSARFAGINEPGKRGQVHKFAHQQIKWHFQAVEPLERISGSYEIALPIEQSQRRHDCGHPYQTLADRSTQVLPRVTSDRISDKNSNYISLKVVNGPPVVPFPAHHQNSEIRMTSDLVDVWQVQDHSIEDWNQYRDDQKQPIPQEAVFGIFVKCKPWKGRQGVKLEVAWGVPGYCETLIIQVIPGLYHLGLTWIEERIVAFSCA